MLSHGQLYKERLALPLRHIIVSCSQEPTLGAQLRDQMALEIIESH